MSSATTRSGFDTWVGSAKPSTPHSKDKYLSLDASGGAAWALVYFAVAAPRGATIISATLRMVTRLGGPAATLTATRVTKNWKVSSATWDDRPTDTATGAATATIVSSTKGGQVVEFDVTAQAQAMVNGAANYGWKIATSATTTHYLYGMDSGGDYKPVLQVVWSDAPSIPTTLNPSDSTVAVSKPTLQFDYTDVSGNTSLSAVQVQIDPDADAVAPAFDSGSVATTSPEVDLTETAFAGLVSATPTQWRVRVQDGAGLWSGWSDWVTVTYLAKTPPAITNLGSGTVYETTPPILWSHPAQTAFQVLVYDAASTLTPLHDSGKRTSTATSYSIPSGVLTDDRTYLVEVRVWDSVSNRAATPGDPTYSASSATFVVDVDPSVDGVATLTASTSPDSPFVDIEWTRPTTPDSWTLYEDDRPILADLDPADVFVSGSTYLYRHPGARPLHEHVYSVRAVVNGAMSPAGPTATATPVPAGLWLIDPDDGLHVTIWGDDEGTWNMTDDATVYTPLYSTEVVRIITGMRGLEGSLSGFLIEGFGKTFSEQETDLYALKSRPVARLRLVASDENIEVLVGNVRVAPRPTTRNGRITKAVSFDFWQVGVLPFDPVI